MSLSFEDSEALSAREQTPLMEHAVLHELLGGGRHGTAFLAELQLPCNTETANTETVHHEGGPAAAHDTTAVVLKLAADGVQLDSEADALHHLAHPNIVQLLACQLPDTIAVEYCDQGTLADRIARDPIRVEELHEVFLGVSAALEHIHSLGWIHGDVTPANIGLRSNDGAALLDLATARVADGGELQQGTEAFTGDIRTATTAVDIRCAAVAALVAIGEPNRWDIQAITIRNALKELVSTVDAGTAVGVADLRAALDAHIAATDAPILTLSTQTRSIPKPTTPPPPPSPSTGTPTLRAPAPGLPTPAPPTPPRDHTRDFGPRPGGSGDNDAHVEESSSRTHLWVLVAAAIFVITALAIDFTTGLWSDPTPSETLALQAPEPTLAQTVSATSTMETNEALWDVSSGTLTRATNAAEPEIWKVGQPGDLAAIGDWDCNGSPTLGVFRPATGTWFTFASWDAGSTSHVEQIANQVGGLTLDIAVQPDGCAVPRITSVTANS